MKWFSLLLIILFSIHAYPQFTWQQTNGPVGGTIFSLHSGSQNDVYAGTTGGLYRTTNNGTVWTLILDGQYIHDITTTADYIFVSGESERLYKSSDNGASWYRVSAVSLIGCIASYPGYVIAGTEFGSILISNNNGDTWKGYYSGQEINDIVVAPSHIIYAAGSKDLFRSTNNGDTWEKILSTAYPVQSLAVNSLGHLYAGAKGVVYLSIDNGNSWSILNNGLPDIEIIGLTVAENGYLYAATGSGIYRSTNNGILWQQLSSYPTRKVISNMGNIYAGLTYEGMMLSKDNGGTFTFINNGLVATYVSIIAANSNAVYAVTLDGISYSTNSGATWIKSNIASSRIYSLLPLRGKKMLAGTMDGLFLSQNGSSWKRIDYNEHTCLVYWLAASHEYIYAVFDKGKKLYRSRLNANSWTETSLNAGFISTVAVNNTNGYIYAGISGAMAKRSTDNGVTWTNLDVSNLTSIAINAKGHVFATSYQGVFRSMDDGITWTKLNLPNNEAYHIIVLDNEGNIFINSSWGIYFSSDNGETCRQIYTGLNQRIIILTAAPDGYLYAGSVGGGVFRSTTSSFTKSIISEREDIPSKYNLNQNYPNPFNPVTNISFSMPEQQLVTLKIYNLMGEEVSLLINERKEAGSYNISFNGSRLTSGVYFYTLKAGTFTQTKKFILMK